MDEEKKDEKKRATAKFCIPNGRATSFPGRGVPAPLIGESPNRRFHCNTIFFHFLICLYTQFSLIDTFIFNLTADWPMFLALKITLHLKFRSSYCKIGGLTRSVVSKFCRGLTMFPGICILFI